MSVSESGAEGLPRNLGRYVVVEHLASGGMGSVYLALQSTRFQGLDRVCVLKTIRTAYAKNGALLSRFMDEAKMSLLLSHKNLCTTIDVDNVDGLVVLAMEHIAGKNLRDVYDAIAGDPGSVTPEEIVAIAAAALEGLDHAHNLTDPRTGDALGLVHRDISPHNVMVSFAGDVKVIDFGVARSRMQTVETAQGSVVGKFRYMAPEQIAGLEVDRRADVACVGIILIELLSGQRFYGDGSEPERVWTLWEGDERSPALDSVPRALVPLLERAVARDPNERIGSAAALRDALFSVVPGARSVDLRRTMARIFPREEEAWRHHLQGLYRLAGTLQANNNSGPTQRPMNAGSSSASADAPTQLRSMPTRSEPSSDPTVITQRSVTASAVSALATSRGDVPEVTTEPSGVVASEQLDDVPTSPQQRPNLANDSTADAPVLDVSDDVAPMATSAAAPTTAPTLVMNLAPITTANETAVVDLAAAGRTTSLPMPPRARSRFVPLALVAVLLALAATFVVARMRGEQPQAAADAGFARAATQPATVDAGVVPLAPAPPAPANAAPDAGVVDAGADAIVDAGHVTKHVREKPPPVVVVEPRPALLGQRLRFLDRHCATKRCAAPIALRAKETTTLSPALLQQLSADVDACLDSCGVPR